LSRAARFSCHGDVAMKTQRDSQGSSQKTRRVLRVRLLVAVLSPIVFLLALEVALRVVGYGQSGRFFVRWKSAGRSVHLTNRHYCEHFVPKALSRVPESCVLGAKPLSTIRVVVLGGSAAFGDPDAAYGFCRQLEVLLEAHSETMSFQVINAAVTSMNSHVARRIARDCAVLNPDVFVVYMGNNEVVGPYGPPTLPAPLYASGGFINLCISARKESRLGQLMNDGVQALREAGKPQGKWMGMEAFLTSQITRDDPRMASCYRHFRRNLCDIIETAQASGAATVLCTVPTNIRSCAPFGSAHRPGLPQAETVEWERLFAEGRTLEPAGDFARAMDRYEQAWKLDTMRADLAFCMGKCAQALGQADEAKRLFVEARDLDTLRFRADSPINKTIRLTARDLADQGAILCDLEAHLEGRSRDHLLGEDLLADHVHLNFRGTFLAAMAAMQAIGQAVPQAKLAGSTASEDELFSLCRHRLLYDNAEAYRLAMVMYRRKTLPPFVGQIDHDSELARLRRDLVTVYRHIKGKREPESWYADAVAQAPLDSYLNVRYGKFLLEHGRVSDAIGRYEQVLAARPFDRTVRYVLAQALARAGMKDQAIQVVTDVRTPDPATRREALLVLGTSYVTNGQIAEAATVYEELARIHPRNLDVWVNLAAAAMHTGDYTAVKRHLDRALKLAPNSAQAMINMGNYYARQNQPGEAQQWFAKAVAVDPHDHLAHIGLGIQSVRLGQIDKGLRHAREAVILKPDFREGYEILAAAYGELGKPDEARRYAELRDLFAPALQRRPIEIE